MIDAILDGLMFLVLMLLLIVLTVLLTGFCLFLFGPPTETPCSEYVNYSIQNVPARCLSYFEGR